MANNRISSQRIVLSDGSVAEGKNIRLASVFTFSDLGGTYPTKTVGTARVNGREIPVRRTCGRSRWEQAGDGVEYSAHAKPGYGIFEF
jgi:hypothetical protein